MSLMGHNCAEYWLFPVGPVCLCPDAVMCALALRFISAHALLSICDMILRVQSWTAACTVGNCRVLTLLLLDRLCSPQCCCIDRILLRPINYHSIIACCCYLLHVLLETIHGVENSLGSGCKSASFEL